MRRVVVTGIGIISSIGNNTDEVLSSLKEGKSGIVAAPDYTEHGFRSQIHGMPKIDVTEHIEQLKVIRFLLTNLPPRPMTENLCILSQH